jgi:hypothetical protein
MADELDPKRTNEGPGQYPNEEQSRSNQEEISGSLDEDEEEFEDIDESEEDEEDLES